tara:strand:+ start:89 stop:712 length:624 start_codon:yes stop_codon:yes gene_type:complete
MPTFKHLPTGKRFFFAHIPRTAGRFIISNLKDNNEFVWDDLHLGEKYMYNLYEGVEIGHFHREYYEKYLYVKDIPQVAVVRNPITKFQSASFSLPLDINILKINEMEGPCSSANWFRPQVDFITKDTEVWKFENGFGKRFVDWISGILGIDLEFDDNIQYPILKNEFKLCKFNLTSKHLDDIRNYYSEDFTKFYPDIQINESYQMSK